MAENSPATNADGGVSGGGGLITFEKIDRVANWVGATIAAAFFASLERCSCIHLATDDDPDDEDDEVQDRPLMLNKPVLHDAGEPDPVAALPV